jgi:hypothetical protein
MTNLIVGLILLALGAWGVTAWWDEFGEVLRGLIPIVLLLVGFAAIGTGMKSRATATPESEEESLATPRGDIASPLPRRN